ncbi:hypothetical protein ACIF8T_11355 [Streptomyces sp. NPDC085946]|uniref:hypothetical protein n=1 Tax=Streptomyces sp. NPDC085946 TaxID=3365744 RepID=UPI0037D7A96D
MKKRSMLAIASLATGFVVAAVTPSHALGEGLGGLTVDDTLSTLDGAVVAQDSLSLEDDADDRGAGKKGAGRDNG